MRTTFHFKMAETQSSTVRWGQPIWGIYLDLYIQYVQTNNDKQWQTSKQANKHANKQANKPAPQSMILNCLSNNYCAFRGKSLQTTLLRIEAFSTRMLVATFSPSGRPRSSQILVVLVPSVMPGRDNAWNPLRHFIAWFLGKRWSFVERGDNWWLHLLTIVTISILISFKDWWQLLIPEKPACAERSLVFWNSTNYRCWFWKTSFQKIIDVSPFFPSPPASLWPSCGPNLSCNHIRSHQPLLVLDNSKYSLGKCLFKSMDALTIQNSSTRRVAPLKHDRLTHRWPERTVCILNCFELDTGLKAKL